MCVYVYIRMYVCMHARPCSRVHYMHRQTMYLCTCLTLYKHSAPLVSMTPCHHMHVHMIHSTCTYLPHDYMCADLVRRPQGQAFSIHHNVWMMVALAPSGRKSSMPCICVCICVCMCVYVCTCLCAQVRAFIAHIYSCTYARMSYMWCEYKTRIQTCTHAYARAGTHR